MKTNYSFGELVLIKSGAWKGFAGVISWPITEDQPGYVLIYTDDRIAGAQVTLADVTEPDETCQNFSLLAYHLLKLSSHVIEKSLLQSYKINQ